MSQDDYAILQFIKFGVCKYCNVLIHVPEHALYITYSF